MLTWWVRHQSAQQRVTACRLRSRYGLVAPVGPVVVERVEKRRRAWRECCWKPVDDSRCGRRVSSAVAWRRAVSILPEPAMRRVAAEGFDFNAWLGEEFPSGIAVGNFTGVRRANHVVK